MPYVRAHVQGIVTFFNNHRSKALPLLREWQERIYGGKTKELLGHVETRFFSKSIMASSVLRTKDALLSLCEMRVGLECVPS